MGSLTSALAPILQVGSTIGTIANVVQPFYADSVARKQQKQQDALQLQQNKTNAALQKKISASQFEISEADRRSTLKRAMARQRAQLGGSGIGTADGSSEAVLLGLFKESDEDRARRETLDSLRNNVLDQSLSYQQQLNLLQQAQLQEKQTLSQLANAYKVLDR